MLFLLTELSLKYVAEAADYKILLDSLNNDHGLKEYSW